MWHIKHETDTLVFSEQRVIKYERPYLENGDGVRIRRIGGSPFTSYEFGYRGSLGTETVTFTFYAGTRDRKDTSTREYNVNLVHSLLQMSALDDYAPREAAAMIRLIMANIKEALTDFPEPEPIGPNIPRPVPQVSKVTFTVSLSPHWDRYKAFFEGESCRINSSRQDTSIGSVR